MGFMAPAMPWIVKGASLLGGFLGGRKAQSSAMQRSPEEAAALTGAQGAAGNLSNVGASALAGGTNLLQTGQSTVAAPTSYYQTLLRGNRAAQSQAVAAPRAAISDIYSGAQRSLEQSGVRGAARDVASGELSRERAGKMAGLVTGVQPAAAEALTRTGLEQSGQGINLTGQAGSAYGNAGSLYSRLLGTGAQNRYYGREEGEKAGQGIGGFLFDILRGIKGKGKPAAGGFSFPTGGEGDFGSADWMTH